MPYPYFCPSGAAGSSAWMLLSHCFWAAGSRTLPVTRDRIQVAMSSAVEMAPPAAVAYEGFWWV